MLTAGSTLAALGMFAAVAQAHDVAFSYTPGTGDSGSCGSVTYSYSNFTPGSNQTTEYLTVGSGPTMSKLFNFSASTYSYTPPYPFDDSDTWSIPSGTSGQSVTATATWTAAQALGAVSPVPPPSQTFTLSCAPTPTYTGDAYNLYAGANLLNIVKLSPLTINQVGPVSTKSAESPSSTILTENLGLIGLNGAQLYSSVTTGNDVSTANTGVNSLSVLGLPLGAPAISTGEIQSTSTTSCNTSTGTLTSTGSTTIASLSIGSFNITIPSPLKPNTVISLGLLGSVTLNEQYAITDGLAVNAIDIRLLTNLGLGSVQVIIGHAESDVEGC